MALKQVSVKVNSNYINEVSGYTIEYNISQIEGYNAESVNGSIKKDGKRLGNIMVEANGAKNVYLEPGISDEDSILLYNTVVTDAKEMFAERNKQ